MSATSLPIVVVDNYDSFTHNVVDLLRQLGAEVRVVRNDAIRLRDLLAAPLRGVVLSPGPGRPEDAGLCLDLVRGAPRSLPILGICLGHQVIAAAHGARIVRAARPLHGEASEIHRVGPSRLLEGLPDRFPAARYHSLVADPRRLGRGLRVTCRSAEGEVMGLASRTRPVEGVQFHPESYLSPLGPAILAAFCRLAGLAGRGAASVVR